MCTLSRASAYVLTLANVAAVIVGARSRAHLSANVAISELQLTPADLAEIAAAIGQTQELDGDVYALERDTRGRHGAIMKYNLNQGVA